MGLKVFGWSDYQIWKKYRIPIPVIQKANKDIERQTTEDFDNKGVHAVDHLQSLRFGGLTKGREGLYDYLGYLLFKNLFKIYNNLHLCN